MKWFPKLYQTLKAHEPNTKTKWILICLLIGCLLLTLPSHKVNSPKPSSYEAAAIKNDNAKDLEKLLSKLTHTEVRVLYTYRDSGDMEVIREESTLSKTDGSSAQLQTESKPMLNSNKDIIIKNRYQPKLKGVCIFYFGTYDKEIEHILYRAAKSALGAELHTVEVIFQKNNHP